MMQLSVSGGRAVPINSSDELASGLARWGERTGDFVILNDGDVDYIQSAIDDRGYIVEVRDGSTATMYRAVRRMPQPDQQQDRWSRTEALALVCAYFPLRARSGEASWENMHIQTTSKGARVDWYRVMSSMRMIRTIMLVVAVAAWIYFVLIKR